MKAIELLDTWSLSGTSNYHLFEKTVLDLTANTIIMTVQSNELELLSLISADMEGDDGHLHLSVHSEAGQNRPLATRLSIAKCLSRGMPESWLKEIVEKSKLIIRFNKSVFFTSAYLSRDLAARAQLSGDGMYDPTDERDKFIMSRYIKAPNTVNLLMRKCDENFSKIFAMPSRNYCHIRQTILFNMIAELKSQLGEFECDGWYIDHNITKIHLSFPEKAKDIADVYHLPDTLIPGVILETSDTGDCSLRVAAAWKKHRGGHSTFGVFEREHRGKFDENVAIEAMNDKLIPMYTKLPERLCELLEIDITEPGAAIETALKMCGAEKALGKKRYSNLIDVLTAEIPTSTKMTGYDIAMLFMDLPCRTEDARCKEFFQNAAGKLPYMDFDKIATASSKIVLTPL